MQIKFKKFKAKIATSNLRIDMMAKLRNGLLSAMGIGFLVGILSGCTNGRYLASSDATSSPTPSSGPTLTITNVTIAAKTSGSSSSTTTTDTTSTDYSTSIFFSASSGASMTTYCSTSTTSTMPCQCKFSWEEVNNQTGSNIPFTRSFVGAISGVQSSLITCDAPSVYSSEITSDTVIRVSVEPVSGSTESFSMTPYNFTKNGLAANGSFQDAEGRAFDNVHRYTCFEKLSRGMTVTSRRKLESYAGSSESLTGSQAYVTYSSHFCAVKQDGSVTGGSGCDNLPEPENTAQSYYYNLFIRNTDRGGVNEQNEAYVCPRVKESLNSAGTVGSEGQYYPMDTQFALALTPSTDFAIGVEARSRISIEGDSSTASSTCYSSGSDADSSSSSGSSSILSSCLGFAAKPNSDGTCPYFKDSDGQVRLTYRLRRFYALYPPIFDTTGDAIDSRKPATDLIYVMDRPVSSTQADPLQPYTMRGPKPCPFSYFDHKGVLSESSALYPNGTPGYAATNYSGWSGVNVDGIEFPNSDSNGNSCSATMPLYNADSGFLSLGTVNATNPSLKHAYVRPARAWAPHYEEDLSFAACAPEASPRVDPPLHFAKDSSTGNVGYCAEVYPTQNDNVSKIEKRTDESGPYIGYVVPFTSHVVKNSASATCDATIPSIPSQYPSATGAESCATPATSTYLAARHVDNIQIDSWTKSDGTTGTACAASTCDRTVQTSGLTWEKFPLVARAPQTESAISSDSTYSCMISWDNSKGKSGKQTPSGGCCGTNVYVTTGNTGPTSAHLEPDAACLTPSY